MKWASAISERADLSDALDEVVEQVSASVPSADLAMVFATPHHAEGWNRLPSRLRARGVSGEILGCSAGGVIGGAREVERAPALSLTVASLPDVAIAPFRVPSSDGVPYDWLGEMDLEPEHQPCFLLLPDPFSCDAARLLQELDGAFPLAPKLGGLASGGSRPGQHRLFLGEEALSRGGVGLALYGDIQVETVVAQGARPIGRPLEVTRAARNVLHELDGAPALAVLEDIFSDLTSRERAIFQRSPMVGVAMTAGDRPPTHGDFLVRNLLGVDREQSAVGVGVAIEVGDTIQFHLRDAAAASAELDALLVRAVSGGRDPAGALLFSCLGRGEGFYGEPHHDASAIRRRAATSAIGGFFCNGEFGPLHGQTYLHSYTSAVGLFRPRGWS